MAEYLLAINGDEARWNALTDDEMALIDEGHREFRRRAGAAVLADGQLEDRSVWTTVRADRAGATAATDGPFAETKEMLGGFYVIDVPSKADAVELASLLAETRSDHSGVEVIPLVVH